MFNHENGKGLNQAKREGGVDQKLVQLVDIIGLGHADVERLKMSVHRQGQQHDIKQTSLDGGEVEFIQAGPHFANFRGRDDPIISERTTDG